MTYALPLIRLAALIGSTLLALSVHAQIFKYVDPVTGAVEYTNQPKRGALRMESGEAVPYNLPTANQSAPSPAAPRSGRKGAVSTSTATVDTEPRAIKVSHNASAGTSAAAVDSSTQKTRDGTRRQVLAEELSIEEKQLNEARAAFNSGRPAAMTDEGVNSPKYIERTKQLEKTVRHHERNVAALKQEISNIRM